MRITYPKDVAALLKGAETLLVVAPARGLRRFPHILSKPFERLVGELAKEAKPGDRGAVATTLTGGKPRRLAVGSLPDKVSRHNCEARPECIRKVLRDAAVGRGKDAVLFVLDDADHALPALNAMARTLSLYSVKSSATGKGPGGKDATQAGSVRVLAVDPDGTVIRLDRTVKTIVDATRAAARLVDTPPTEMNPEAMVREARKLLKDTPGVRTSVIAGPDLLRKKLGGLHAVGRTAKKAPRMFVATYTPRGKAGKKHVALVGKGITYDTGGLSIKGKTAMPTMKSDMGGAAATLGAFKVLAATGCKYKVSLILCLAENAIGPDAYKPDDVLTMHSGLTVEINNTDAEGRVVLADGVSYAARVLRADTILDAATLTGAQLVATGVEHAAVVSNKAKLESKVVAAGYASGDLAHPLMFCPEFYKREFASAIADMRNSVRNRGNAQASCAAQFIYWHIEDTKADWCHVDLAGPAFPAGRGTGFGVALLADAVRRL